MNEDMHDIEIKELHDKIDAQNTMISGLRTDIQPMLDTFNTLRRVGKWAAVGVAFLGSLATVGLAVAEFVTSLTKKK